jgi:MFS family permease
MNFKDWLTVIVVAFAGAFLGAVFTTVAPVVPLIAQYYGGGHDGSFVAEWLLTMPSIGIVVGGPMTGWFVERFGARAVLLTCFVLFGLSGMAGLVVENMNLLLASRFVVGVMAAGQATAATAVVGERFTGARRASVMGIQIALATLLGVGITLAGGALAHAGTWRAPFALYGLAFAVVLLAVAVVGKTVPGRGAARGSMGGLLPLLPVFATIAVTMMVSFINSNQVPLVLNSMGATDPSLLSAVLAGSTLATTVGALAYSRLRGVLGPTRTSALGGLLQAAAVFFLATTQSVAPTVMSAVLLGFGSGILYPSFTHIILDRAPESVRGRAIGLLFTAQFTGPFLSTSLVFPAMTRFGRHDTFLVIAAVVGIGWLLSAARSRAPVAAADPDPVG